MKNFKISKIVGFFTLFTLGICSLHAQDNFKLPAYETFTLDNGLEVYFVVQKEVPLVHFRAVFPAGVRYDSNEKSGLADLTATALPFGTKNFSKSKIEETLDFLGASISTSASTEAATLAASFVNKDLDQVLPILVDMITQPAFPSEEVEKQLQRNIAGIDQMRESPRSVIGNYFNAMVYQNHPYANPASGTKASLSNIQPKDVASFYKRHYTPSQSVLAVVGDFDPEQMRSLLNASFRGWTSKESSSLATQAVEAPSQAQVTVVHKADARETTMLIGGIGVPRNTPDYIGIQLINTILGGRFTSWLNDELRVNSGLTYGARSGFTALKEGGTFSMSTFTANETTQPTIELALKTYQKLLEEGVDEKTLTSAKNYMKGQFPPDFETNAAIARFLTDAFVYDIPLNYIDTFNTSVNQITVQRAKEIIATYFPSEQLQMVFIGNASIITPIVSKYGLVKQFDISEDRFH